MKYEYVIGFQKTTATTDDRIKVEETAEEMISRMVSEGWEPVSHAPDLVGYSVMFRRLKPSKYIMIKVLHGFTLVIPDRGMTTYRSGDEAWFLYEQLKYLEAHSGCYVIIKQEKDHLDREEPSC